MEAERTQAGQAWSIRRLDKLVSADIDALSGVLIDCVDGDGGDGGDGSLGFLRPLERGRARAFWEGVALAVQGGERAILVAEDERGLCGSVQLVLGLPENQPHRADVTKLMVHRRARRLGLGAALVRAAESTALGCGRDLLVLDAVTGGDAARLYARLGWVRVGDIPGFALTPRGVRCGTTVFYRDLSGR